MDQIESHVENLSLSDSRQQTAGGFAHQYFEKSSSQVHSERNGGRTEENTSENNLAAEGREGFQPIENDDSERRSSESYDDSDEDSSSEDEEIKAPIELLGEFLHCVRSSDWENASKLCKMILIYEPDNALALQFHPVIEEKSKIEEELAEMSSSSDDEESSSEEETSDEEIESDVDEGDGIEQDQDEEPEPRPGSTMKNPLIFLHHDPAWRP